MAQTDPNAEDALDDLVSRVKKRRADGKTASVPEQPTGGLRPSEILLLSGEQKKLIHYLSRHPYASLEDIRQALNLGQADILKILSGLEEAGFVHKKTVKGEIFYRVKYIDTTT